MCRPCEVVDGRSHGRTCSHGGRYAGDLQVGKSESKKRVGGQRAGAGVVRCAACGTAHDVAEKQVIGISALALSAP